MLHTLANLIVERVYSAATIYTEAGAQVYRADRPCWALVIKYEGETVYRSGGRTFISNANHLAILPRGCSYYWQCVKAGHYGIIEFQSAATQEGIISVPVRNSGHILNAFKALEYRRMTRRPLMEMESIRDVYSILLELMEQSQKGSAPSAMMQKLAPAAEYISQHYNTSMTNDELARLTGFSTAYFRKLFTEVYGASPIAYARELRIKKAKEMLRSDYASMTDVALSLGYPNIYDFSRDFKKRVGLSPTKYISTEMVKEGE